MTDYAGQIYFVSTPSGTPSDIATVTITDPAPGTIAGDATLTATVEASAAPTQVLAVIITSDQELVVYDSLNGGFQEGYSGTYTGPVADVYTLTVTPAGAWPRGSITYKVYAVAPSAALASAQAAYTSSLAYPPNMDPGT